MGELISIIIPVYKVEKYLCKCIDSIIGQDYSNLEIILVDDGSPDKCGQICDSYAKKDNRISVIHQNNGGLSTARNSGMKIARGKYIGFVDSDDYIEKDMYSYLYGLLKGSEADISMCAFHKFTEDRSFAAGECSAEEKIDVYDNEAAMKLLISDDVIGSQPCNKLFRRSLWDGVFFPDGRVYEDLAVMHYVFARASKVVVSNSEKYNYLIRSNSTSYTQNRKWTISLFYALKDRSEFIQNKYPKLANESVARALGMGIGMYIALCRFCEDVEIIKWKKEIRKFIIMHKNLIDDSGISMRRRLCGKLIASCPGIITAVYKAYYRIRRMNSNE